MSLPRFLSWRIERLTARILDSVIRRLYRRFPARYQDSFDVLITAQADAALTSARYYQEHMLSSPNLPSDLDLLEYSVRHAPETGLVLEFGVATGRTINHLASLCPDRTIYGFDVFSGLPETWRTGFSEGTFAREHPPTVRSNVRLVPGLFESTLPAFLEEHRDESAALVHIDCDLYSSTRTVLDTLAPRLRPGSIIVFDEFFNYPGWKHHEFKAWQEFVTRFCVSFDYLGLVSRHQQVAVKLTAIKNASGSAIPAPDERPGPASAVQPH